MLQLVLTQKRLISAAFANLCGEPAGIQTPSLLIRSQMLYSIKLQARFSFTRTERTEFTENVK